MMAKRVLRQLVDDLDGSPAVKTVRFAHAGREYEIDLNEGHAAELNELLAPYLRHARRAERVTPRRGRRSEGERRGPAKLRAIRQWAREQGLSVADRGRIAADVVAKYDASH